MNLNCNNKAIILKGKNILFLGETSTHPFHSCPEYKPLPWLPWWLTFQVELTKLTSNLRIIDWAIYWTDWLMLVWLLNLGVDWWGMQILNDVRGILDITILWDKHNGHHFAKHFFESFLSRIDSYRLKFYKIFVPRVQFQIGWHWFRQLFGWCQTCH